MTQRNLGLKNSDIAGKVDAEQNFIGKSLVTVTPCLQLSREDVQTSHYLVI